MPPVPAVPIEDDDSGVNANVQDEVSMINNDAAAAVIASDGDNAKTLLSTVTEAVTNELPLKRKRKTRQDNFFVRDEPKRKKSPQKKKKVIDPEEEFASFWICSECKEAECMMKPEADQLLICEGACRRLFHYPCAGLAELPAEDEEYVCADCKGLKHACSICHHYGVDNEDVFCCSKDGCGLFFHESCLAMQNVEVRRTAQQQQQQEEVAIIDESASDSPEKGTNGSSGGGACQFICPAHNCWTCTQQDTQEKEEADKASPKKKGKKKKSKGGAFDNKTESRIVRCLECPTSYHVTCIPPPARFHELAMLCHEHASTFKLPELDAETSMQDKIEKSIDEKYDQIATKKREKVKQVTPDKNPFFPGISGDKDTGTEAKLLEKLKKESGGLLDDLMFCLPCDIKDEVHAIPPLYHHVQSLKIDPAHKPSRIPPSGDSCLCKGFCGDDCLNRMLYVECFGDSSNSGAKTNKHSNCKVGLKCGNRKLGQRKFAKSKPAREHGKGWGLMLGTSVMKGDLIQEYVGEVIDEKTKTQRLADWAEQHPNDPNFYVMALTPGWFIDARHNANLSRFVNHSCEPNCILLPINVGGHIRNGIFAMRDIVATEFLSYDYQFDTRQGDRFACRCGARKCRGTMKGGAAVADAVVKKTKNELWQDARARFDRDKKFLEECTEDEERRGSQVDATVPGAESKDETVAAGAKDRHRDTVQRNRICLWRNVVRGSDFAARLARLEKK